LANPPDVATFSYKHGIAARHAWREQHRHVQQHRDQRQRRQGFDSVAAFSITVASSKRRP